MATMHINVVYCVSYVTEVFLTIVCVAVLGCVIGGTTVSDDIANPN